MHFNLTVYSMDSPAQKICVLLGTETKEEDRQYCFLSGAFLLEESWFDVETGEFTDETWSQIYQGIRTFFPKLSIQGWVEIRNEFAGRRVPLPTEQKLLLQMDTSLEEEERLLLHQGGQQIPIGGYFIYYERNEAMQTYMQGAGSPLIRTEAEEENEVEAVKADAAVHFRTLLNNRREEANQKKVMTYLYLTSSFLVMIVFVIGITMINNYDKMRSMEKSLLYISETLNEEQMNDMQSAMSEGVTENMTGVSETDTADDTAESENNQTMDNDTAVLQTEPAPGEPIPTELTTPPPVITDAPVADVSAAAETPAVTQSEYTVAAGDTLASICRSHYGNCEMLDKVCEVNGIADRDKILYGQKILLP